MVPVNYTLNIEQTVNDYDSKQRLAYGAACPGDMEIACVDDPEFDLYTWTNETMVDQVVYYIQSGWNGNSGTFTLAYSVVAPPACPDVANLSAATQPDGSVNLDWDDAATASGYNYEIQPDGVAQGTAGSLASSSMVDSDAMVASGVLTDGTDYTLYVTSDCTGILGNYQSLDFSYSIPPANDLCAGATPIIPSAEGTGCTTAGFTLPFVQMLQLEQRLIALTHL